MGKYFYNGKERNNCHFLRLLKNTLRMSVKVLLESKVLQNFHQNTKLQKKGMVVGAFHLSLYCFKNLSL